MAKQDLTTKSGIMAAFEAKQLTLEQALDAVAALAANKRIIKRNSSGGLFVRDASFVATSKTGKEYIAGVNVQWEVAVALFNNAELLNEIKKYLASAPAAPEVDKKDENSKKLADALAAA